MPARNRLDQNPEKDSMKSVLHYNGAATGGPLIIPVEVVDIVGAAIREDRSQVAISVITPNGDRYLLGMTPAGVDAMIDTLAKVRADLDDAAVERTIPYSPVHTVQVGVHKHDGGSLVSLVLDRSLPSAAAFLLPAKNARAVATQLVEASRVAEVRDGKR